MPVYPEDFFLSGYVPPLGRKAGALHVEMMRDYLCAVVRLHHALGEKYAPLFAAITEDGDDPPREQYFRYGLTREEYLAARASAKEKYPEPSFDLNEEASKYLAQE